MSAPDADYREENIITTGLDLTLADGTEFTPTHEITFSIDGKIIVTLHGDGRVEYDVPVDEAASAFWSCVDMMARNNGYQFTRA